MLGALDVGFEVGVSNFVGVLVGCEVGVDGCTVG